MTAPISGARAAAPAITIVLPTYPAVVSSATLLGEVPLEISQPASARVRTVPVPLANFPAFVAIPVSMAFDEADAFARLLTESGLGDFFPAFSADCLT